MGMVIDGEWIDDDEKYRNPQGGAFVRAERRRVGSSTVNCGARSRKRSRRRDRLTTPKLVASKPGIFITLPAAGAAVAFGLDRALLQLGDVPAALGAPGASLFE